MHLTHSTKFYKITNFEENHYGFQYKDGLNIDTNNFIVEGSCVPGGLYFTTIDHICNHLDYGCWLREVILPFDNPTLKYVQDPSCNKWRANMVILEEKYPIMSVSTIKMLSNQSKKFSQEWIKKITSMIISFRRLVNMWGKCNVTDKKDMFLIMLLQTVKSIKYSMCKSVFTNVIDTHKIDITFRNLGLNNIYNENYSNLLNRSELLIIINHCCKYGGDDIIKLICEKIVSDDDFGETFFQDLQTLRSSYETAQELEDKRIYVFADKPKNSISIPNKPKYNSNFFNWCLEKYGLDADIVPEYIKRSVRLCINAYNGADDFSDIYSDNKTSNHIKSLREITIDKENIKKIILSVRSTSEDDLKKSGLCKIISLIILYSCAHNMIDIVEFIHETFSNYVIDDNKIIVCLGMLGSYENIYSLDWFLSRYVEKISNLKGEKLGDIVARAKHRAVIDWWFAHCGENITPDIFTRHSIDRIHKNRNAQMLQFWYETKLIPFSEQLLEEYIFPSAVTGSNISVMDWCFNVTGETNFHSIFYEFYVNEALLETEKVADVLNWIFDKRSKGFISYNISDSTLRAIIMNATYESDIDTLNWLLDWHNKNFIKINLCDTDLIDEIFKTADWRMSSHWWFKHHPNGANEYDRYEKKYGCTKISPAGLKEFHKWKTLPDTDVIFKL